MNEEAKIEEQKAAVSAMKNAQANMRQALERIDRLERALALAASRLHKASEFVGDVYCYNSSKKVKTEILEWESEARSVL